MKKMIVLFLLFAGVLGETVLANGNDEIARRAKKAFERRFPNAASIEWHAVNEDVYKVTFVYNNDPLTSYISDDGEVMGTARDVMNEKLPFVVNERLVNTYRNYVIKSAEELITDEGVSYLFSAENEKQLVYTRIYSNGDVSVIRKIKK